MNQFLTRKLFIIVLIEANMKSTIDLSTNLIYSPFVNLIHESSENLIQKYFTDLIKNNGTELNSVDSFAEIFRLQNCGPS